MKKIKRRSKAIKKIYETPELREFVADIIAHQKARELALFLAVAEHLKKEYFRSTDVPDIYEEIYTAAIEGLNMNAFDSLIREMSKCESDIVYSSPLSCLYEEFADLDWKDFTSDSSLPMRYVNFLVTAAEKEKKMMKNDSSWEKIIDLERFVMSPKKEKPTE